MYSLAIIVSVFILGTVVLSYLRFASFLTLNWDLGIPMQALWSTNHGFILYETADYTFFGVHSYLEVHSTYIALLFSKLYFYFPSPVFFFLLQSIVLGASIIPLYLISRPVLTKITIVILSILYLTNFLILSATFWDFHWEAFIPLETLWMFYLLQNRKYLLALVPFIIGISTIEVFPFLSMGILLYFIYDKYGKAFFNVPKMFKEKDYRILLGFFLLSVFAYLIVRTVQYVIIPGSLGTSASTSNVAASVTSLFFFKIGSSIGNVGIYWFMLYASFGFLALIYPKHFIISLPWLFFTIFLGNGYASSFGFQYSYIAISPILLGTVFGLSKLECREPYFKSITYFIGLLILALVTLSFAFYFSRNIIALYYPYDIVLILLVSSLFCLTLLIGKLSTYKFNGIRSSKFKNGKKRHVGRIILVLLIVLIVLNIIIGPLNPNNFGASSSPGYEVSYSENPAYNYMQSMAALVPQNATILASDNLFNFVANDVNAYSLTWFSPNLYKHIVPYFPFNSNNLPKYVLVDSSQFPLIPGFLETAIFNSSLYGLVAYIYSEFGYPGTIYLFELNYSHSPISFGRVSFPENQYISPQSLKVGVGGVRVPVSNSKYGEVIESNGADYNLSEVNLWYGPYETFLPGNYTLTLNVSFSNSHMSVENSSSYLSLNWVAFDRITLFSSIVNGSKLQQNRWINLSYQVNVNKLYPNQEIRGFELFNKDTLNATVTLNFILLTYNG